jgi:transposase-like protein
LAQATNGVSLTEAARRHGLSRELLFRWRREQREKAILANAAAGFIPLSLPTPENTARSSIEIVLASGARLVIGERTDLGLLKRVIAALS